MEIAGNLGEGENENLYTTELCVNVSVCIY